MRVLLTSVVVGRGGDAVQWTALADGFRGTGHQAALAGAVAVRPYGVGTAEARAREVVRRLPWWLRDVLEIALVPVAVVRAWWAARGGVDLIIHRAAVYDIMGPVLAGLLRVPVVAYLDAHVAVERGFRAESCWRWLHEWTARWLGRAARLVVTPSGAIRDYYAGLGISSAKLLVRPNGVPERHIAAGLLAGRTSAPMTRLPRCVLGFAGSLSDWHRVDLLLEALAMLTARADGIAYRALVIGSGRDEPRLRALADRLRIAQWVEWRGPLLHDDAIAAMAEFDIAVLPSTLPTGAPIKLIEYAAMGRSIVAPDLPNVRDLIAPGIEAILVEPGSPAALTAAVVALVHDAALARRLGRAAQARVRAWTWEETARLLVGAASPARDVPAPGSPARRLEAVAGPAAAGTAAHDKR